MGRIKTIARRSFLVGSAAVVGGVAFGAYKLRQTPENPLIDDFGSAALNAFVIIDQSGVTLITPKAEMGQGVQTTWAALIAEELDVDWQDVKVLHGPPAKAYYNSALMGMALPFFDYRLTDFRQGIREVMGDAAKFINLQLTSGSTSMKDGYERMRLAGASARETLKRAAANRLDIAIDRLSTANGQVITPDGSRLNYGDLAEDAARLTPEKVELRDPSAWRFLGTTMPRLDMEQKVNGTAEYASDIILSGMRFATVRMNPRRSGMISFDADTAQKMPGVEKIIDLGEGIAVVATNTWLALQAANAVTIKWQEAEYPATTELMLEDIRAALDAEADAVQRDDGDVETAHQGIEISAEYELPWLAHASMEPMSAVAQLDGDTLEIFCGNQIPSVTQKDCAEAIGLEPEQVTVNSTLMGGSFGRRAHTDYSVQAARIAAEMPGVPIKLIWSREEDFRRDYYRTALVAKFKGVVQNRAGLTLDGKIAAVSGLTGPKGRHLLGAYDQPYGFPNFRIAGHAADLDVPIGYWRSVDNSHNCFFMESFIDEMAFAGGVDPFEFRWNLISKEHQPSANVLEAAAEMSDWQNRKKSGSAQGIAFGYFGSTPVATVCEVREQDGAIGITKVWVACDVGTALDPGNIEAQITGGSLFGLSAAIWGEITFRDGEVEQSNFPDFQSLRMGNAPDIDVKIMENMPYLGGVGEAGTPTAAPALTNALFALTGQRARKLPLYHQFNL